MKTVSFALSAGLLAVGGILLVAVGLQAADKEREQKKEPMALAAYSLDDKTQHVFFRNAEGDIMEMYHLQGDADWQRKNLTAEAKAPRAASNPAAYFLKHDSSQHVIYRDTGNQLQELYYSKVQGRWEAANLTTRTKAPMAAGNPDGYTSEDKIQHVVFRTADGDICEMSRIPEGNERGWQMKNLSAEAKAPKAASDPAGYFLKHDKSQHVVYRDSSDQIQELYFSQPQGRWEAANLTAVTKAPKAAGNPDGFTSDDKIQHVVCRTADGDICEMFRIPEGKERGWQMRNLTAEAKGAKAAGDPSGYFLKERTLGQATWSQHVVYRGTDEQIHELFFTKKGGKWEHANLSAETKAPRAASDPVGYTLDSDRTQHVFFLGENGNVYEIYFKPDGEDKGWRFKELGRGKKST